MTGEAESIIPVPSGFQCKHLGLMDKVWSSLTCFTETITGRQIYNTSDQEVDILAGTESPAPAFGLRMASTSPFRNQLTRLSEPMVHLDALAFSMTTPRAVTSEYEHSNKFAKSFQ